MSGPQAAVVWFAVVGTAVEQFARFVWLYPAILERL